MMISTHSKRSLKVDGPFGCSYPETHDMAYGVPKMFKIEAKSCINLQEFFFLFGSNASYIVKEWSRQGADDQTAKFEKEYENPAVIHAEYGHVFTVHNPSDVPIYVDAAKLWFDPPFQNADITYFISTKKEGVMNIPYTNFDPRAERDELRKVSADRKFYKGLFISKADRKFTYTSNKQANKQFTASNDRIVNNDNEIQGQSAIAMAYIVNGDGEFTVTYNVVDPNAQVEEQLIRELEFTLGPGKNVVLYSELSDTSSDKSQDSPSNDNPLDKSKNKTPEKKPSNSKRIEDSSVSGNLGGGAIAGIVIGVIAAVVVVAVVMWIFVFRSKRISSDATP